MKSILIIEDSKEYAELLQKRLGREGYAILHGENGKKALDILKKEHADLILLDLLMPEVDGISFHYQLEHVAKKHIPIIVITNVTDAAGFGKDVKEVLIKSNVSLDEIASKVRGYLG
ncbi:MAG: response regulator [Candidatus Levyibacteriota bacterium]